MAEVVRKIVKVFYPDEDKSECAYCEADNSGFNSFIKNIHEVVLKDYLDDPSGFVEGADQKYCMFWIDEDNDEIMINNDKSFSIFLKKGGARKVYIVEKNASTTAPPEIPASSATAGIAVHTGVQCNSCDVIPIRGFRYKCAQCSDFDLCMQCEQKKIHSDHIMYRFPVALSKEQREALKKHRKMKHHGFGKHHGPGHHGPIHHGPIHHGPIHHGPIHHGPGHHGPGHHGPGHHGPGHHGPEHHRPGSPIGKHSHHGMHPKHPHHMKHRLAKKMPHGIIGKHFGHPRRFKDVHQLRCGGGARTLTDFLTMIDLTETGEPENSADEWTMETDRNEPSAPEPEITNRNANLEPMA